MNISNHELMNELKKLRADECTTLAKLIYFLAEVLRREMHLSEGYTSMFDFLVRKFDYSEGSAARRVAALKVYKVFPEVLTGIKEGKVKLSNLHLISKHVTPENASELVKGCVGKNKLAMESYIANKFNQSKPALKRDSVKPVAIEVPVVSQTSFQFDESSEEKPLEQNLQQNFRVSVTLDQETYEKLVRLQELSGKDKISEALDVALNFYLAKKDPAKATSAENSKPRDVKKCTEKYTDKRARKYIPISVRREVFKRDGFRCVHTSPTGQRCESRRHLELDHIKPHSHGGEDTPENLQVMCSGHNKHKWRFR